MARNPAYDEDDSDPDFDDIRSGAVAPEQFVAPRPPATPITGFATSAQPAADTVPTPKPSGLDNSLGQAFAASGADADSLPAALPPPPGTPTAPAPMQPAAVKIPRPPPDVPAASAATIPGLEATASDTPAPPSQAIIPGLEPAPNDGPQPPATIHGLEQRPATPAPSSKPAAAIIPGLEPTPTAQPRSATIPGLEPQGSASPGLSDDDTAALRTIAAGGKITEPIARDLNARGLLSNEPNPDGSSTLVPTPAAHAALNPPTPTAPKAYSTDAQGNVQFNPQNLVGGLLSAKNDGLIDGDTYKALAPKAQAAQAAIAAQQKIAAENPAAWKAFLAGGAKGLGFLAASAPGAAAGAEIGSFAGPVGTAAGGIIGGLVTGTVGSWAVQKTLEKLGQYSDTIKSFTDASQLHPYYDAAGNLLAFGAGLPGAARGALAAGAESLASKTTGKAADILRGTAENYASSGGLASTVSNLAGDASIRTAAGATPGQVASALGSRVAGKVAASVAIDTAIKEGAKALGFSDQGQTLDGATQAALIGAFTAGHDIKIGGYDNKGVTSIVNDALIRQKYGLSPTEGTLSSDQIPEGTPDAEVAAIQSPLSKREAEVLNQFGQKINQLRAQGKLPGGGTPDEVADILERSSARQATTGGQPYGVTSFDVGPSDQSGPSAQEPVGGFRQNAPRLLGSSAQSPASASPAGEPPSPSSGQPASPGSPTQFGQPDQGGRSPSPQSAAPAAAGQAQRDDDGAIAPTASPAPAPSKTATSAERSETAPSVGQADQGQTPAPPQTGAPNTSGQNTPSVASDRSAETSGQNQGSEKSGPSSDSTPSAQADAPAPQPPVQSRQGLSSSSDQTAAPAARQDDAVAALTRARDDQQALLGRSKSLTPQDRASVQAMVDHLDSRISALSSSPVTPTGTATASTSTDAAAHVPASIPGLEKPTPPAPAAAAANDDLIPGLREAEDAYHADVAQRVNSGAPSQADGYAPTVAYNALQRVKAAGGEVTPAVARDVDAQVRGIMADPSMPDKQAAVRQLVQDQLAAGSRQSAPASIPGLEPSPEATTETPATPVPTGTTQDEKSVAPSADDSTEPTPVDSHQAIADQINRGEPSDHADGKPSTAFVVLQRIKARGGEITPDLVRNVRENVTDILEDSGISDDEKQAQLKSLVKRYPANETNGAVSETKPPVSGTEPAQSETAGEVSNDTTPAPEPAKPVPSDAPLSQQAQSAQKIVDALNAHEASGQTLTDVQQERRTQAQTFIDNERAKAASGQTTLSETGQRAQKTVEQLSAQGSLTPTEQNALRNARAILDRELNRRALGPNPQPTSEAGKQAQAAIARFQEAQHAGAQLSPSEHAAWKNHQAVLENDFTRQRQALEARPPDAAPTLQKAPSNTTDAVPTPTSGDAAITRELAEATARRQIQRNLGYLNRSGIHAAEIDPDGGLGEDNRSGVQFFNGKVRVDTEKLARTMTRIRDDQQKAGIKGTPEDWFHEALDEEGIHGGQKKIAAKYGMTLDQFYGKKNMPDSALPPGWEDAGRKAYDGWDKLPRWAKVAEFTRMVVQGKWKGRITESLRKHVAEVIEYLKGIVSGQGVDSYFRNHYEEVSKVYQAARAEGEPGTPAFKRNEPVTYQGRRAVVESIGADGKATVRVLAGPDPKSGANLVAKRVRGVDPANLEKLAKPAAGQPGETSASSTDNTPSNISVPKQPGDTESVAVARERLADQRRMGKWPSVAEVQKLGRISLADARRVIADQRAAEAKVSTSAAEGAPAPFKRPSRAAVAKQSQLVRSLEIAANANPDKAQVVERYQQAAKDLAEMQRQRAMPLQPGESPRSFKMPAAPDGNEDVLDHIRNQGGIVSPNDAKAKPTYDPRTGDYDAALTLGGYYHHAVYGGAMMPDRMAAILHEEHGIGDGSPGAMWKAVQQAVDLRRKQTVERQGYAKLEKQASSFDKDAVQQGTAKGKTQVYASNLAPGDKLTVGDQELTVIGIDPHTLDVELEDHSKYGVQKVSEGTALYVEKVEPASGESLSASRPDKDTGSLFGDDEPFDLRGEPASDAERVAAARQPAQREPGNDAGSPPTLRSGEKGQAVQQQAERATAEARAKQDREQQSLFNAHPASVAGAPKQVPAALKKARELWAQKGTDSPFFQRWFAASKVVDAQGKPLVVYHGGPQKIETFDHARIGERDHGYRGKGFYFSTRHDIARELYAQGDAGNVVSAYVKLQKPYVMRQGSIPVQDAAGFTQRLMDAGYDGVMSYIGTKDEPHLDEIVAFHPDQIKSATDNSGEFDPNKPSILAASAPKEDQDEAGFHSQLARTIAALPQETMTVAQARAAIEKGSKPAERDFTGIFTDPLSPLVGKDANAKVTKTELRDYTVERQAHTVPVTLGRGQKWIVGDYHTSEKYPSEAEAEQAAENWRENAESNADSDGAFGFYAGESNYDSDRFAVFDPYGNESNDSYDSQEEAEEAAKEKAEEARQEVRDSITVNQSDEDGTHFGHWTLPHGDWDSYREAFVTWPGETDEQRGKRRLALGDAVSSGKIASNQAYASLDSSREQPTWEDGHSEYGDVTNPIVRLRYNTRTDGDGKKALFLEEMQGPQDAQQAKMPDFLRKRIYEIGMKRALRIAADEGADRLAWTTGQTQAHRYSLEKHLDALQYGKASDGNYFITGFKNGDPVFKEPNVAPDKLESYVGKDLAKSILSDEGERPPGLPDNYRRLSGAGLKVGGDGLKRLYDQTLPRIANDLTKKFGLKAGQATVATPGHESGDSQQVHSIDIPDTLKQHVQQGQALFASAPDDKQPVDGDGTLSNDDERNPQNQGGNRPEENRGAFGTNKASAPGVPAEIGRRGGPPDAGSRPASSAIQRESLRQVEALAKAAKSNGQEIQTGQIARLGPVFGRGQEHLVRRTPDGQRAVKMTVGGRNGYGIVPYVRGDEIGFRPGTPSEYFDRLALQNKVFGDDQRYEGITRDGRGEARIVTSQPFIKGERPTSAEIARYMAGMGFEPVAGHEGNAFYRASDNVGVFDAHEGNFIKSAHGIVPIDVAAVHPDDRLLQVLEKGLQGDSLGASAPDDEHSSSFAQKVSDMVATGKARNATEDRIAAAKDAVQTRAAIAGKRAGSIITGDLPDARDQQAATAVVEAGGNRDRLAADLAKVQSSSNPELAKKYAPVYQHALDNLPRLQDALENYQRIKGQETSDAQNAGIERTPWQPYVQHVLDSPELGKSIVGDTGMGMVPGHEKFSDAIAAGVDPRSMSLADATESMVRRNRQAINDAQFRQEVAGMKASDGKPILSAIEETRSKKGTDGNIVSTSKVPHGYEAVQAGPNVLTVHKEFAPLLKALYGESAFDNNRVLSGIKSVAAVAKHGTAVLDTYHAMRVLAKEVLGFQTVGYGKGLAALDYAPEELDRAVKQGRISQEDADFARQHQQTIDRGLKAGLNVGKISDNLLEGAKQYGLFERLPVVGKGLTAVNDLIFHKLTRGAMTQAFTVAAARNRARFPELSRDEVDRRSAKEVNEFFGNLGNQGFFKSKTMQDAARVICFAPNWAESQARSEVRGYAQVGKAAVDAVRGKGFRPGVVAQAMAGTVLSSLVAAQAINLFTRHQTTWQNQDENHKWDAWIPGGPNNRGFWFSPLSIGAEYAHALKRSIDNGGGVLDAAAHVASNKLSGPARGAKDLLTGEDYTGRPFGSTRERLTAAAADTLPSPMPLSGVVQKDPKAMLGYGLNHQPGSIEKQFLGMGGMKVDPASSARAQMFRAAEPFRMNRAGGTTTSAYSDLRRMLDNGDLDSARAEVGRLIGTGHKLGQVGRAFGIGADGVLHPELYTGSKASEAKMLHGFTADQRKTYFAAQKEHAQLAQRFRQVAGRMQAELTPAS